MHFPKWVYHKNEPAKIIQSKEEFDKLSEGWEETPAAFDKKQASKKEVPPSDQEPTQGEEPPTEPRLITLADYAEMNKKQLAEVLKDKGFDPKEIAKLSKDDMIAKIGEL